MPQLLLKLEDKNTKLCGFRDRTLIDHLRVVYLYPKANVA